MKYCGQYSNKIDMSLFDEISIIYNKQDSQLISFLQGHLNQRIILIVKDVEDFLQTEEWKKLNAIQEKYPEFNFAVCFKGVCTFQEAPDALQHCIKELKIPFFTGCIATNFDQLQYLCNLAVSDVYLAEDICFDLKRARAVCDHYKVQIRAFPNVGQCSVKSGPALKKFFIRPEDVEEYSDCIDTLEFWGPLDRQVTLLQIYKKGIWFGDLKDLILDFDLSFDSKTIMPDFARVRKNCGRKCIKGERCSICDTMYRINQKLADKNIIIKQKKPD